MPEIVLIRHGETAGQSSIRLWGATDVSLSELGEEQMQKAASAVSGERFDHVFVSPLSRSQRSAQIVLEAARHPPMQLRQIEAFREIDFGEWEGLTHEEAAVRDPEAHARWRSMGAEFRFPGGESRRSFEQRAGAPALDLFEGAVREGAQRVLGVLHKGVIKVVMARLLALGFDEYRQMPVDLASVHRLRGGPGSWNLISRNEIGHLDP
jgi:broad specificity phosphatase PhoE